MLLLIQTTPTLERKSTSFTVKGICVEDSFTLQWSGWFISCLAHNDIKPEHFLQCVLPTYLKETGRLYTMTSELYMPSAAFNKDATYMVSHVQCLSPLAVHLVSNVRTIYARIKRKESSDKTVCNTVCDTS